LAEKKYYSKVFGKKFFFIKNNNSFSTKKKIFKNLDESSLIITLDSTLGYEAIARGKKVLFFSVRNNLDRETKNRIAFCWPKKT